MDKRAPSYVCERPQRHSANLKPLGCTLGQWNRRNLSSGRGNGTWNLTSPSKSLRAPQAREQRNLKSGSIGIRKGVKLVT